MVTANRLKKFVSDNDFPDAVAIDPEVYYRVKNDVQQELELDIVTNKDVESYINTKILLRITGGKKEFELYNISKERD
jgi:hypothetical protein